MSIEDGKDVDVEMADANTTNGDNDYNGIPPPSFVWQATDETDWDKIELNCIEENERARAWEDQKLRKEYEADEAILQAEREEAICEHNRLVESLLQARVLIDERQADIEWLADEFQKRVKALAEERAANDLRIQKWIDDGRREQATSRAAKRRANGLPSEDEPDQGPLERAKKVKESNDNGLRESVEPDTMDTSLRGGRAMRSDRQAATRTAEAETTSEQKKTSEAAAAVATISAATLDSQNTAARHSAQEDDTFAGVDVFFADGAFVGKLGRISPENHWVQTLLERPIQRAVEIRLGRKCTQAHLDSIVEVHDQKRSKWLSFMIQATGDIQERACQTCAKGQGLFSLCTIVGGTDLPRCGNCEWNKQGCHGATPRSFSRQTSSQQHSNRQQHTQYTQRPDAKAAQTRPNSAKNAGNSPPVAEKATQPNSIRKDRRSRAKDQRPATPQQHAARTPVKTEPAQTFFQDLGEISLQTLALKHDGMIFLEPEIMYGVPLRKISPEHAYWEPAWKPIEAAIQSKLEEWMGKLMTLKALPEASLSDKDRTAIFQAGRQVNRGKATLKFLASSDFHPFQLVGKRWITPSLTHYDTLFRMVKTLNELPKFRLDVTPLQWLRQRLHEIYSQNPAGFKLDRTVAKLYHDSKLEHLRLKNGFGNIGRPSAGTKTSGASGVGASGSGSVKKTAGQKRKDGPAPSDSAVSTPTKRPYVEPEMQTGPATTAPASVSSQQTAPHSSSHRNRSKSSSLAKQQQQQQQRERPSSSGSGFAADNDDDDNDDDLEYSGYTSTDSLTHDAVIKNDWRVYQVKTMNLTTNPGTTQYWHWVDEKHAYKTAGPGGPDDFDPMFEHQVLKETEPATGWGVFKEPIDFHLRLRELTNISYARDSQKVIIGTRQVEGVERRGNVLALFKRERTKRRFLAFMRKKGIGLVRTQSNAIEDEWNSMQSELMPGNESD